ncbi:45984_t:CDS:2 [Gigaspora margarita]|uniref:45984_t:CDS:1 n=1 Tax=Gigaspora margarita TaxID=4874 RepID=A0ABN7VYI0_GIGMA|nr:45984_t:CDS:2 [Gigaspora margarita]
MTSNTNNKTDPSEKFLQLYEGKLGIDINPVLEAELRRDKASSDKPIRLFDLLLYLEGDIVTIQEKMDILTKKEQKKLIKMQEQDDPGVILPKYVEMGVKKIRFTREELSLFPNLTSQQLHKVFVKNSASTNQCPCLEQVS